MLVISKLTNGADSWTTQNGRMQQCFHQAVIKLYRRLAKIPADAHVTDVEVLCMVRLPSPEELLRRARLRYFATLVHAGLPDIWAILACDKTWCGLLEDDMIWMWQQLKGSSRLPHPQEGYEQWLFTV